MPFLVSSEPKSIVCLQCVLAVKRKLGAPLHGTICLHQVHVLRHEKRRLFGKKFGDEGCKALAAALGKEGAAPRLRRLGNQIGDEGCSALAAALGKEGAAPRLETLDLTRNQIGDEGCKALAAALGKEGAAQGSTGSLSTATRLATRAARRWPPPSRRGPPRA